MAVWWCGGVAVWRCGGVAVGRWGGVVVWWCGGVAVGRWGGVVVWWCGGVAVGRCGGVVVWRSFSLSSHPVIDAELKCPAEFPKRKARPREFLVPFGIHLRATARSR